VTGLSRLQGGHIHAWYVCIVKTRRVLVTLTGVFWDWGLLDLIGGQLLAAACTVFSLAGTLRGHYLLLLRLVGLGLTSNSSSSSWFEHQGCRRREGGGRAWSRNFGGRWLMHKGHKLTYWILKCVSHCVCGIVARSSFLASSRHAAAAEVGSVADTMSLLLLAVVLYQAAHQPSLPHLTGGCCHR
jgi:hypothetical protein